MNRHFGGCIAIALTALSCASYRAPAPARAAAPVPAMSNVDTRHLESAARPPFAAFFAEEEHVAAQVTAEALAQAQTVIADHAIFRRGEDGPELSWYPALGLVAAHERLVIYGEPKINRAAFRTDESRFPFRVIITVPCRIWSRSGEGIPFAGDPGPPEPQQSDPDGTLPQFPISTAWIGVERLTPAQQKAALAARASCAAAAGRDETVAVPLTFVLHRESGTVLLERGELAGALGQP